MFRQQYLIFIAEVHKNALALINAVSAAG